MAVPALLARIDWANVGSFSAAIDTVHPLQDQPLAYSRGRSANFGSDVTGQLSMVLDNSDFAYSQDRNWCDNPSFEVATTGWSVAAVAGLTAAATSITQVADAPAGAGSSCGELTLPATGNAGAVYLVPYVFRAGYTYSLVVALRSFSGSTSVQCGISAAANAADIATAAGTITGSWATYSLTWTPTADRTGAYVFVRGTTAAAAVVHIDAVQLNPGASANPYIEAPTRGQLNAGAPIHLQATYSAVTYPLFYGKVQRITPDPAKRLVTVLAYDTLKRYDETNVAIGGVATQGWTARDARLALLDEAERGSFNLLPNPSFETSTNSWSVGGGAAITQIAGDAAPVGGVNCGEIDGLAGAYVLAAAYLSPITVAGQWQHFSVYLRCPTVMVPVTLSLYTNSGGGEIGSKTVYPTGAWQRFDVSLYAQNTYLTSAYPLVAKVLLPSGGSVRMDAAMVTRGQGLSPYSDTGIGRAANLCLQASFDAGLLSGWCDGWQNLVANPSFETNTAGWSTNGDSFTTSGATLSRVAGGAFGSWSGKVAMTSSGQGCYYDLSGIVFKSGRTYSVGIAFNGSSGGNQITVGIGSNGTPTDKSVSSAQTLGAAWSEVYGASSVVTPWTPTADRTDVHLYIRGSSGGSWFVQIDGVMIAVRDSASTNDPSLYSDLGPVGVALVPPSSSAPVTFAKYGTSSQRLGLPATVNAGRVYDFLHAGAYFVGGRTYSVKVVLACDSATASVVVAIGANKGDGTWDVASTTASLTVGTWTEATLTWTPAADYNTQNAPYGIVLAIYQSDGVARNVFVNRVRVIAAAAADAIELPQWNCAKGAESSDTYSSTLTMAGAALGQLQVLNQQTLTRHWCTALAAAPWYSYNTVARDAVPTIAETFLYGSQTGPQSLQGLERDREAVVNVVQGVYGASSTQITDSDEVSVAAYGVHPYAQGTVGTSWLGDRTAVDAMAAILLGRYSQGVARPTMLIENRWPSQLQREVGDVVVVSVDPWDIVTVTATILRVDMQIDQAGQHWATTYQLEEYVPAIPPASAAGDLARAMPE